MIGKPKFKQGDKVSFMWEDQLKIGYVDIVDAYGTFEQNEEPSYDILIKNKEEHCLYKHFRESLVKKVR